MSSNLKTAHINKECWMYWIHCNKCFQVYTRNKNCRLFIFACHHIVCEKCTTLKASNNPSGASVQQCAVCGNNVHCRAIGNAIIPQIKMLLHPYPWLESLHAYRLLQFQMKHRYLIKQRMIQMYYHVAKLEQKLEIMAKGTKNKFEEYRRLCIEQRQIMRELRDVTIKKGKKSLHQRK